MFIVSVSPSLRCCACWEQKPDREMGIDQKLNKEAEDLRCQEDVHSPCGGAAWFCSDTSCRDTVEMTFSCPVRKLLRWVTARRSVHLLYWNKHRRTACVINSARLHSGDNVCNVSLKGATLTSLCPFTFKSCCQTTWPDQFVWNVNNWRAPSNQSHPKRLYRQIKIPRVKVLH